MQGVSATTKMDKQETTTVKVKEPKKKEAVALAIIPENYNVQSMSAEQMQQAMTLEAARRKLITQYVAFHMKDGVDFGRIHISRNCQYKYELGNCKDGSHWSRPNLFKPGSEKFVSLFKLRPVFKKDTETLEMLQGQGIVAYVCELYTLKGEVVGEGRGAAAIKEKESWTPNNAIKIAQKRAQIDAVLRTGALSDFFTQDLEDTPADAVDNLPKAPAPAKTKTEVKVESEKLFAEAKAMIQEQKDPTTLADWKEKIDTSERYTVAQKLQLTKLINAKIQLPKN